MQGLLRHATDYYYFRCNRAPNCWRRTFDQQVWSIVPCADQWKEPQIDAGSHEKRQGLLAGTGVRQGRLYSGALPPGCVWRGSRLLRRTLVPLQRVGPTASHFAAVEKTWKIRRMIYQLTIKQEHSVLAKANGPCAYIKGREKKIPFESSRLFKQRFFK